MALLSSLASCSAVGSGAASLAAKAITSGGGPTVNANAQLGAENSQAVTLGTSETVKGNKTVTSKAVEASTVHTVNVNPNPIWYFIIALIGWELPSRREIALWIRKKLNWTT